jgi:hypothetical protein
VTPEDPRWVKACDTGVCLEWWETDEYTMLRSSADRSTVVLVTAQEWGTFIDHVRGPQWGTEVTAGD